MTSHSTSNKVPFGAAKLCQDISTLVNNRKGSDIQFKVGGRTTSQENGNTIYDESETVTLYAHSVILRCRSSYFATMLDEEKIWKESSTGVIHKPNISPNTFYDVLHYIYTGSVRAKTPENIMELIAAADEMDLDELSVECQNELIRIIQYIFSDQDEEPAEQRISIDIAIRTYIIPALDFANSHLLSHLLQELLTIVISNMPIITNSPDAYTAFVNEISSETLLKIITSNNLVMAERNVWDLALTWACYRTKLSKSAIEAHFLSNPNEEEEENDDDGGGDDDDDDEELSDGVLIRRIQLEQLKKILTPFLSAIRFSLLGPDDYKHIVNILIYMLPRHRLLKINEFFISTDGTDLLDTPRKKSFEKEIFSEIVVESTVWGLLKKKIFETGGITGCQSLKDLKFQLLFRASEHGFLASTFHERCDNQGPTLVLARSDDGYLFGGVNFNHWRSDNTYSSSTLNFLFILPDGYHRKDWTIFKTKETHSQYSSFNVAKCGPIFGGGGDGFDLLISHSAKAYSNLPNCYDGNGASNTALAGREFLMLSDYEVFAIFK